MRYLLPKNFSPFQFEGVHFKPGVTLRDVSSDLMQRAIKAYPAIKSAVAIAEHSKKAAPAPAVVVAPAPKPEPVTEPSVEAEDFSTSFGSKKSKRGEKHDG